MKVRMATASFTDLPRTTSMTMRTLRGELRINFAVARTSMSSLSLFGAVHALGALDMALEEARQRELAELVTHHVLGDIDRHMAASVVNTNGVAHHLGEHRRV